MTEVKKYIIYKIINTLNNKVYIGKHETYDIDDKYFGSGVILKMAIKKYGKENFIKNIIEFCENLDHLNEREIYWINNIDSITPKGYNINIGGKGGDNFTNNPNKEIIRLKMTQNRKPKIYTDADREKYRQRMLGTKLPNHKKIKCEFCSIMISKANHNRWHGIYCKSNPNKIEKITETKKCEFCDKNAILSSYTLSHGKNCKSNPNKMEKITETKKCEFCDKNINIANYKNYHGFNCKQNPLFINNNDYKNTTAYTIKIKTENTRKKNGDNRQSEESNKKRSNTLKGRIVKDLTKEKMSISRKLYLQNKTDINYICKHCNKQTTLKTNYVRWHDVNCKLKIL